MKDSDLEALCRVNLPIGEAEARLGLWYNAYWTGQQSILVPSTTDNPIAGRVVPATSIMTIIALPIASGTVHRTGYLRCEEDREAYLRRLKAMNDRSNEEFARRK